MQLTLIRIIVNILSTLVTKCFVALASFDQQGSPSTVMKGIYFTLIMQMKNCVRFLLFVVIEKHKLSQFCQHFVDKIYLLV